MDVAPPDPNLPRKPEHSLPLYEETTLEKPKKRHQSREDVAERDLKGTRFAPGVRALLIGAFLLTIGGPAAVQFAVERYQGRALPSFVPLKALPTWSKIHAARSPADFWNLPPQSDDIKNFEKGMEKDSVISNWLLPHVQSVLTGLLGAGNEQAYPGRGGWLFYRPDVEYAIGEPFLDPALLAKRERAAGVVPDPVPAIIDFRDQLRARGIDLIVFPVPVKPVIDGAMLWKSRPGPFQNPSLRAWKDRLTAARVRVFDPTDLLVERKKATHGAPLYLETDTHWRPETMELVAGALARSFPGGSETTKSARNFSLKKQSITALGDIAQMLKLPTDQTIYRPQTVTIHQVHVGSGPWRASPDADTLLLGDSFSNIFSLEAMGWGDSAGLAEHLSYALGKPIDAILRNSDGSFATREILSKELARGHDRLAGKKLVIWELAARELAIGNWKLLPLKLSQPGPAHFFSPRAGGDGYLMSGTVESVSTVPLPGSVPYKDHIMTVHLVDLAIQDQATGAKSGAGGSLQALAYLWSMRDNVWTLAARLRPGDAVKVRLRAWADVSEVNEKINRSELDDPALELEEPVWGDLEK